MLSKHLPLGLSQLTQIVDLVRQIFVPEFIGQKIYMKGGTVVWVADPETHDMPLIQVRIDDHRDCQSVYPANFQTRVGTIEVSWRFVKKVYKGMSVPVFCQYSRHRDDAESVKLWIAN